MKVLISDLKLVYESEIKKNVKNKKKIYEFEKNKIEYISDIKRVLENGEYDGGRYNIFMVYKPKIRIVMSQSIYDKIINHYVARFILIPHLNKYLNERNCATRKNMGTHYAIKLLKSDIESFKKYKEFYFLKLDISKFFYNLDHNVLLSLIKSDLNIEEYNLIKVILNSTNREYVNVIIKRYENMLNTKLPLYNYNKGLPIGNMTSQFLAIFYLSKLQHFIRCNLHLKFINYMDDYIIIHQDKEYLKKCLKIIEEKLNNEYKLELNKNKTNITKCNIGVNFLGYNFKVIDNKTIVTLSSSTRKNIKDGLKKNKWLYKNKLISFESYFSSIENYKYGYNFVDKIITKDIIDKIIG